MKRLILLRHAKSDWSAPELSDHERPLNKRGRSAASKLGTYFRSHLSKPDLVLCSSAVRTRETLQRLEKHAGAHFNTTYTNALYGGGVGDVISLLRTTSPDHNAIVVVGHNPCIQDVALGLSGNNESALHRKIQTKVPTGSIIILEFNLDSLAHVSLNSGKITHFIRPKHELMAAMN